MKAKNLITSAFFASLICISSLITIPVGIIPITLTLYAVMLSPLVLGLKKSLISVIVYILVGLVGLPVFSGFRGGFSVLLGPTGGYILSYILIALILGLLSDKSASAKLNKHIAIILSFVFTLFALTVCYFSGTIWYSYITQTSFIKSLSVCVLPFVPFDIAKCLGASITGYYIKKNLKKSKLL